MIPGVNPRQMKQAMKKMGIQQTEIPATEVIIRTVDRELVIQQPQVSIVSMMGQKTYQVVGEAVERSLAPEISDEDISTVAEQAGVSKEEAERALKISEGDLARAIMDLS